MLKTGWKSWDEYLETFATRKTPLQLLDAGGPKEEITKWFIKNLASNPYTKIYSIQPRHTIKNDHLVKVSMNVEKGLVHLLDTLGKESIDIAFLNLFHETQDATEDCIRIWKLLKTDGILILDDLVWREIEYERYYSRAAIINFIRVYAPEMKILYTGYQIICEKLDKSYWESFAFDYKEYPLIHYADWRDVMKDVNRISDKVMNMKTLTISTNQTRRAVRHKPLVFSEPRIGTTPSFTELDAMEVQIKSLISRREQIMFNSVISPKTARFSKTFQDELGYLQPENFKQYSWLKQSSGTFYDVANLMKYESHVKQTITLGTIERFDTGYASYSQFKNTLDFYKTYLPALTAQHALILVKDGTIQSIQDKIEDKRFKSIYFFEKVENILENKYESLKPQAYESFHSHSINSTLFSYTEYSKLNCHGRDSKTIYVNLINLLIADRVLVKDGILTMSIYGGDTPIICEFLSLVSELFTVPPSKIERNNANAGTGFGLMFRGYKGMTEIQRAHIVSLFRMITRPDQYFIALGISCNPSVQHYLTKYKTQFKKRQEKILVIAKEFHTVLENIPVSRHAAITNYLISQRITNYSIALTEFISSHK